MKNSKLKIESRTTELRCQKCYRLHPLEFVVVNNSACIGYRCPFHKKAGLGYYYLATFIMQSGNNLPYFEVKGHLRHLEDGWYEVSVFKKELDQVVVSIQERMAL